MPKFKCYECDGAGEWDEGPLPARSMTQLEPDYRRVICPECKGEGELDHAMCCMCRDVTDEIVMVESAVWCKACHDQFTADMATVG